MKNLSGLVVRVAALLGMGFMLVPLVLVTWLSFFSNSMMSFPPEGYTFMWFLKAWEKSEFLRGFVTSVEIAALASAGGLALGIPASLGIVRYTRKHGSAFNTALLSPLIVPGVVIGTALYLFFVEAEVQTGLPLTASVFGLAAAHILITIPWTVRVLTASLQTIDRSAEEAAMSLGARPVQTLRLITFPLIRPGIVAAALFSFVISFGNLEMTMFLVGPGRSTLPIAILQYLEWKIDPIIAAVSVIQTLIIALCLLITNRFISLSRVV